METGALEVTMDATMTETPLWSAPAAAGRPRTEVNEIRTTVPALATPVWSKRLAVGLGWFSVGLGLTELAAPGAITRWLGVDDHPKLVRAYGLREIAAGVGILTNSKIAPHLWGRVAGDTVDLASLGAALRDEDSNRKAVAIAIGAVVGVTLLDILAGKSLSATRS
jgi:hypothetical protein